MLFIVAVFYTGSNRIPVTGVKSMEVNDNILASPWAFFNEPSLCKNHVIISW